MSAQRFLTLAISASLIGGASHDAVAQWSASPIPVCTAAGNQRYAQAVSDGHGGAIVVWLDTRPGAAGVMYAQRFSHAGIALWATDGVPVLDTPCVDRYAVVPDEEGGVLIAASCPALERVTGQHVSAEGTRLWTATGAIIPAQPRWRSQVVLTSDGAGGAIVAWIDRRGGCDVLANRVSSDGGLPWTAQGVSIRTGRCDSLWMEYDHPGIAAISDGSGGAILVWTDYRQTASDVFAQRIEGTGAIQWAVNGLPVCDVASVVKNSPAMTGDGAGGAIVVWHDTRIFQFHDYAQRIDPDGQRLWPVEGVVIDATPYTKHDHNIVSDGAGGAFIDWSAYVSDTPNRRIQRMDPEGAESWDPIGIELGATAELDHGGMASDDAGGAFCTWFEPLGSGHLLKAQRVDANGQAQWDPNGTQITAQARLPLFDEPSPLVSDGSGGLIVAWEQDGPNGTDLFTQKIPLGGPTVSVPRTMAVDRLELLVTPNPSRGATSIAAASPRAVTARVSILDLGGRVVRDLGDVSLSPQQRSISWDGFDARSSPVRSGLYFARCTAEGQTRVVPFTVLR